MQISTAATFTGARMRLERAGRSLRGEVARVMERCGGLLVRRPYDAAERMENPWERYWGEAYGPDLKRWLLKPVFEELEAVGKLGSLIVDIGSGAIPVTGLLPKGAGRRRILIDIAGENARAGDEQRLRLDVEVVARPGALSHRKGLRRVCEFLGMDGREGGTEVADAMVFSDLLNYVDYREVLGGFARYLKKGGRMIITNLPMRGNEALFSEKGLKNNEDLYRCLEGHGFGIEQKLFPCREEGETAEAEELIVLVARKGG